MGPSQPLFRFTHCLAFYNIDYSERLTIFGHFHTMLTGLVLASGINSATGGSPVGGFEFWVSRWNLRSFKNFQRINEKTSNFPIKNVLEKICLCYKYQCENICGLWVHKAQMFSMCDEPEVCNPGGAPRWIARRYACYYRLKTSANVPLSHLFCCGKHFNPGKLKLCEIKLRQHGSYSWPRRV